MGRTCNEEGGISTESRGQVSLEPYGFVKGLQRWEEPENYLGLLTSQTWLLHVPYSGLADPVPSACCLQVLGMVLTALQI